MLVLLLQLILAIDVAALTWLFLLAGRKQMVRAFRLREMKLLMGLTQGVIVIDEHHRVLAMNKEATRLFPKVQLDRICKLEKVLPLFDESGNMLPGKTHPLNKSVTRMVSVGISRMWVMQENVHVPIEVSAAYVPSSDMASGAVVGLIRDVSKEALMERMKTDFIGIASHQLRSPLASLKWYGEILTHDARESLDKQRREYLDRMNDATARMISLVDDFLDVSKFEISAEPAHVDKVSFKELMSHIIDVHRPMIESKKLKVRVSRRGEEKQVYADPAMLREVLANLVANAVKYNRNGGKVLVDIYFIKDIVEIKVKDTGVGIPKDQQDRVFTKFFRADNAVAQGYKGTGLGLYTAKLILEQMKGDIRFESQQGKGTTFWVQFPRDQRSRQ